MKRASVLSVAAVLAMASIASATTVWNPAANGISPPAVGDWGDVNNWTNGLPDAADKAVFNVPGAAEAQVSGLFSGMQIVQGDGNDGGVLRVLNGGSLSTKSDSWSAVGYNNVAHAIVETGGTYSFGQHAWIGLNDGAVGTLDINGGTVTVGAMLGLGWGQATSQGFVNVNDGGLLDLFQLHGDGSSSIKHGSLLSINGTGRVTLPGNYEGVIQKYVDNGLIAGNGIVGNIKLAVTGTPDVDQITTVTAIPEPGTLLLLGLGLGGLFFGKRR